MRIISKASTDSYRDGWERIYRNREEVENGFYKYINERPKSMERMDTEERNARYEAIFKKELDWDTCQELFNKGEDYVDSEPSLGS